MYQFEIERNNATGIVYYDVKSNTFATMQWLLKY